MQYHWGFLVINMRSLNKLKSIPNKHIGAWIKYY